MIDIPIRTERLTIRRFHASDMGGYLEFMLDEASTRFLAFEAEQKTESEARELFDAIIASYDSPDVIHAYAIVETASEAYLGSCGIALYEGDAVECYYCVNAAHRGRGIAAEATNSMIQALSPQVEIRAYCHTDNIAAHAVATRCGMVHVGRSQNKNTGLDGELFIYGKQDR